MRLNFYSAFFSLAPAALALPLSSSRSRHGVPLALVLLAAPLPPTSFLFARDAGSPRILRGMNESGLGHH